MSYSKQKDLTSASRPPRRLALVVGRAWRIFGTALCFALYAPLAWCAGVMVLPVLMLWPGSSEARQRRVRSFVAGSFRCLLAAIAGLRLGRVEVEGRQWLQDLEGTLVVANHPMYLDAVALIGLLPQADCIVKQALWRNPFYRRFVRVIGYIGNAGSHALVEECVSALSRNRTMLLFPEGTRTTPGEPLHFERGAAQVAVRSGCPVVPVVIECKPLALGKHQAWYEVADRPWVLRLRVLPPRTAREAGVAESLPHGVAARRLNRKLEALFVRELGRGDRQTQLDDGTVQAGVHPEAT